MIFEYRGGLFPEYIKNGNACQHIAATARHFCRGRGIDVGSGKWPLEGALAVEVGSGFDAMNLPGSDWDYIFSSHCLEHLSNPIVALEYWASKIRPGGVLFLYLPHKDMTYWLPQNCRKHLHSWSPADMAGIVADLGFKDVIHSERDLAWSFAVVGTK